MNDTTKHVAALVGAIFEAAAATLRERGESAHASVIDLGAQQQISLEVDRERGDWQRNLVVLLEANGHGASVDVKILDDEQISIAQVGAADVAYQELPEVALAVARAGATRLLAEVSPATAVA